MSETKCKYATGIEGYTYTVPGNTPVAYLHPDDAEIKPLLEQFNYSICDLARAYVRQQQELERVTKCYWELDEIIRKFAMLKDL